MDEITKEARIKEELDRISVWFDDVDENQRAVIDPLIQNSAFMKVTLNDLQKVINAEGVTEEYKNGANQYGQKPSATLQSYNSLIKNYASVQKTLFSLLPKHDPFKLDLQRMEREPSKEVKKLQAELDAERAKRIHAELTAAAEKQKREREADALKKKMA